MKSSKNRKRRSAIVQSPARDILPADMLHHAESLPARFASAFTRLRHAKRARLLQRLLMPVGPMAMTVLAGGAFAKFAARARLSELTVSIEEAARVTWNQVFELGRYVEQSSPQVLQQVMVALSRDATAVAVGAALVVRHLTVRDTQPRGA